MSVTPGRNNSSTESSLVTRVFTSITGTGTATLWTPATGRGINFRGCSLRAWVGASLVGATAGDSVFLMSGGTPYGCIAVIRTATDAAGTDYGVTYFDSPGVNLSAINTPLTAKTGGTIGAGNIQICGYVWGDEVS